VNRGCNHSADHGSSNRFHYVRTDTTCPQDRYQAGENSGQPSLEIFQKPHVSPRKREMGLRSNGPKTEAAGESPCTIRKTPFLPGQHLRTARLHRLGW
jgi:hypothetical protein